MDLPKIIDLSLNNITLSTVVFCLQTIFAVPISPRVENFTPSFVTEMTTAITKNATNICVIYKLISSIEINGQNPKTRGHTCVTNATKIFTDPLKLRWRHPNNSMVFGFRNPKVLAINVHQFHLKISNLVLGFRTFIKTTQTNPSISH